MFDVIARKPSNSALLPQGPCAIRTVSLSDGLRAGHAF
jgi:hypothetical protein